MSEDKCNFTSVYFRNGDGQSRAESIPELRSDNFGNQPLRLDQDQITIPDPDQLTRPDLDQVDGLVKEFNQEKSYNSTENSSKNLTENSTENLSKNLSKSLSRNQNSNQSPNKNSNESSSKNASIYSPKANITQSSINQPHHQDDITISSFCTINSNGKLADDTSFNRNAENYEKYDFAIPLPFSEYKAPPKRSELSSFMHNPLSKTLDTFSKLSSLLKEDQDENSTDALLFGQSTQSNRQNVHNLASFNQENQKFHNQKFPPPSLPEIEAKNPKTRQPPITEHDYDTELKFKSKLFLFERIFLGGLESDSLRRRLWPILLGVMEDENEANWIPLTELYNLYMMQWKSITPDQESRFTAFKEKKSMAERDVVRCDRAHPYFQKQENIDILKDILMCYIMYDFDTGYVQGMTDLAAPLLFVFEGDPIKAFWCFVGVLNLTKKNFEMEQTTVKNLLIKLFKLINLTDPCFAEFLADNESDNCYFAFRWLICLFKREFVKADNSYDQLLFVWDSLFSVPAYEKVRLEEAQEEIKRQLNTLVEEKSNANNNETTSDLTNSFSNKDLDTTFGTSPPYIIQSFENRGDFDESTNNFSSTANRASDSEHDESNQLTNFELLFLSISLAIIRQERDLIFTQKLDASEIIKHFNNLNLNDYLNETLRHATLIYNWLKYDGGEEQLYEENVGSKDEDSYGHTKCSGGFDLLDD